jgi:hypothetical protein
MYNRRYGFPTYARCKVGKDGWFWVVYRDVTDVFSQRAVACGYESTAAAADAAAEWLTDGLAMRWYASTAREYHRLFRRGRVRPWAGAVRPWWVILGLQLPCGVGDVKAAYRRLAKVAHPDAGGTAEDFRTIETAYREALAFCARFERPLAS